MKKILIGFLIVVLLIFVGTEIATPFIIKSFANRQIEAMGIEEMNIELTSPRPHLLRVFTTGISGKGTMLNFQSTVNFHSIEVFFNDFTLEGGEITFKGLISEQELNNQLRSQWDPNMTIVLSEGVAGITLPLNIPLVQLQAQLLGEFALKPNNKVVYEISSVELNLPGFDHLTGNILTTRYELDLPLDNLPNIAIKDITILEGFVLSEGIIVQ